MKNETPTTQKSDSVNVSSKYLRILFIVQALLTFAAGMVLIVVPELIPSAVGIRLNRSAYLVCYLLAAQDALQSPIYGIIIRPQGSGSKTQKSKTRTKSAAFY